MKLYKVRDNWGGGTKLFEAQVTKETPDRYYDKERPIAFDCRSFVEKSQCAREGIALTAYEAWELYIKQQQDQIAIFEVQIELCRQKIGKAATELANIEKPSVQSSNITQEALEVEE